MSLLLEQVTESVPKTIRKGWSGTPPVETTTSRNKNARNISPKFCGNPYKLRRILQISTKIRKKSNDFSGTWWKITEIRVICVDFCEKSAKCCEHFCFDWSLFRLVASRLKPLIGVCSATDSSRSHRSSILTTPVPSPVSVIPRIKSPRYPGGAKG